MKIKRQLQNFIRQAIKAEFDIELSFIEVDLPERPEFGDYSSNVSFVLKENIKKSPQEIALQIKKRLLSQNGNFFSKIEVKGGGFLNFFVSPSLLNKSLLEILKRGVDSLYPKLGEANKVNIEFISANPTGPLTLGNARGAFCGDVLSRVMERDGFKVVREYYINDRGNQITELGKAILGTGESYQGDYLNELKKRIKQKDAEKAGREAADLILKEMIIPVIKKIGVRFDVWFRESTLYEKGEIDKVISFFKEKDLVYEKSGALYFKSSQFGDDKDRVLIKNNGQATYFLSDIAYLKNKFERGFQTLIFFWGADHHGYINRIRAAAEALGYNPEQLNFLIVQLVRLFENGREVKMSKREGRFFTIEELLEKISVDVARFFFLLRKYDTHLDFDLSLAATQSEKNPVFYIQYAHARIHSLLQKAKFSKNVLSGVDLSVLKTKPERMLMHQIIGFEDIIEKIIQTRQVHYLPHYTLELAKVFHRFYTDCPILASEDNLKRARLVLTEASRIVLKECLSLMGISSPESM